MANIMLTMMELQTAMLIGTSLKTVSQTMLVQQLPPLRKHFLSSLAPQLNTSNPSDFPIALNMMKLVKPKKDKKVTSHSNWDSSHTKIFTSYSHGTLFLFPKISSPAFLNSLSNMVEFQQTPTFTKFLPGTNPRNLVAKNLTSVTSLWTVLSQHLSSETRIFSSDIKDPTTISKFIQNGLHICQPMEKKANVHLLTFGNEIKLNIIISKKF